MRTKQGELFTALIAFRKKIEADKFVIVESKSLRRFINLSVYLQVFDPSISDFKPSAQQYFDPSDAYILVNKADQRMALTEQWAAGSDAEESGVPRGEEGKTIHQ